MKIPVGKRYGDAKWKRFGMGVYTCTNCYAIVNGNHRIYCPKCGAQMYNDGDLITSYDGITTFEVVLRRKNNEK